MARRRKHHPSFVPQPLRFTVRRPQASKTGISCEKCGETDGDVQQIETKRGPEQHCFACRYAHFREIQSQRIGGLLKPTRINFAD